MNLPGFSAPSAAWLFALLVPLILFYFLKLRRPREVIPSLVLWRQVLQDQRVNSPFQKFRRNLLLIVQVLLLLLLVLAAMQPYLRRQAGHARRLPVMIDCSASMAALDKAGGASRLAQAKQRARALLETLPSDAEISLISFAKTARKRTTFTNDKRLLSQALEEMEVEDVPGDIEDALHLAQALARSEPFDEVLLLSDGNFPSRANFELSFNVNYQRIASAGPNFGITACNARRAVDGKWEIFVQIESSAEAEGGGAVQLSMGGTQLVSERFTLTKGGFQRMTFSAGGEQAGQLEVRLVPDGFDSLAADNVAWLDLPAARPLIVYVPEAMAAYRHALAAIRDVHLVSSAAEEKCDLVISDRSEDVSAPAPLACYIDVIPEDVQKLVAIQQGSASPVDWRRDSPLLQHVDFTDVVSVDDPHSAAGVQPGDFANAGYDILVHGPHGPMMLEKQEEGKRSAYLLFHTDHTTLPYRVGFPVFVTNLVQAALKETHLAESVANHTGALPPFRLTPKHAYEITSPGGTRYRETTDEHGVLSGLPALRAGEYSILDGGEVRVRIGASLLSPAETTLKSTDQIQFNEQLAVSAASAPIKADRALWYPLACIAFVLLLVEWWLFQRNPRLSVPKPQNAK